MKTQITKPQKPKGKTFVRFIKYFFSALAILLIGFTVYFFLAIRISPPEIQDKSALLIEPLEIDSGLYGIENARIRRSESGLWELYIEGKAFERGVHKGKLTQQLVQKQEEAFTDEIKKIIPSQRYLKFLKYFIAWFNRNIQDYIPEEYLHEIYGVSFSASEEFSYIGSNYERLLNYHGAHDIGHALSDLAMVGCTSFSLQGTQSEDGNIIIGRNFDFYVGDQFAEDKIVAFVNPANGHSFAMIVWGGFSGVVSGMNTKGLTLTMNAAKSNIPFKAAAPVSLIAREILQYAETIEEAFVIAQSRQAFVSEAFMIGSAKDKRTAIIEITPKQVSLFDPKTERIIGPNHFQSEDLKNSPANLENLKQSSSLYRYQRMHELLDKYPKMTYLQAAKVLRNPFGKAEKNIGMGNEKAINQLIAHHSVIFKPDELKMWVSSNPFQLGKYVCYDLNEVFELFPAMMQNTEIYNADYTIPADSFLYADAYVRFQQYKTLRNEMHEIIKNADSYSYNAELPQQLVQLNPHFFYAHELAGNYCKTFEQFREARNYYKAALQKEISTKQEHERIIQSLAKITTQK